MNQRKVTNMDYVALTDKLVKSLVLEPDMVTVKEFETDLKNKVVIEVLVSNQDLPRVIGKGGRTINAIRTIVAASSSLHDHKYVQINVEGF